MERSFEPFASEGGVTSDELCEELVHRLEVVVDELWFETGLRCDASGGDGCIALVDDELAGGVQKGVAARRILGSVAPR